jgi:hypothetical protein
MLPSTSTRSTGDSTATGSTSVSLETGRVGLENAVRRLRRADMSGERLVAAATIQT